MAAASTDPLDLVNQLIDQFQIVSHIARGGMADLYLAHDVELDRQVALKVILPALAQTPEFAERFRREARATARLNHPHIVQIYTNGMGKDNRPYIALEYISGGSLADRLEALRQKNDRLPVEVALGLIHDIAEGLQVAHAAGIIHRDLKPSNILLRSDDAPVISDLGIAAVHYEVTRLTRTGAMPGTPHYMAPEQARADAAVDGRCDIYALGIILYELLTGAPPFDADSPWGIIHQHLNQPPPALDQIRPDLSKATILVVNTCLQKSPDQRYQSAGQLLEALDQAVTVEDHGGKISSLIVKQPIKTGTGSRDPWRVSRKEGKPGDSKKPPLIRSLYIIVPLVLLAILFFLLRPSDPKIAPVISPKIGEADPATALAIIITPTPEIPMRTTSTRTITKVPTTIIPSPSPINTSTPVLTVLFHEYLLDIFANAALDFWSPPMGDVVLGGVPFSLTGRAFKSQASGEPHDQYPTKVLFPIEVPSAYKIHLLLNAGNAFNRYNGSIIGSVVAYCDEEPFSIIDLRLGRDIREWHVSNNVVSSASNVRQVWQDGVGHIDLLSLDLPSNCLHGRLTGIEIIDLSSSTVNSLDPSLNLAGFTVERYQ